MKIRMGVWKMQTEKTQTATEWIEEWLDEFPEDKCLVETLRRGGHGVPPRTDEDVKYFLEGI